MRRITIPALVTSLFTILVISKPYFEVKGIISSLFIGMPWFILAGGIPSGKWKDLKLAILTSIYFIATYNYGVFWYVSLLFGGSAFCFLVIYNDLNKLFKEIKLQSYLLLFKLFKYKYLYKKYDFWSNNKVKLSKISPFLLADTYEIIAYRGDDFLIMNKDYCNGKEKDDIIKMNNNKLCDTIRQGINTKDELILEAI